MNHAQTGFVVNANIACVLYTRCIYCYPLNNGPYLKLVQQQHACWSAFNVFLWKIYKSKKGIFARGNGSLRNQARMRMSEKPGISLHFKKILLKECLPPLETPPLSFIPLLSPIENPPNKRQDPTDNMSHVMTTRNIVLHSPFFHPKPLAYFPPQTTNSCYHHSLC